VAPVMLSVEESPDMTVSTFTRISPAEDHGILVRESLKEL